MLDKTIPYKHVLMKRSRGMPIPNAPLPNGYAFVSFEPGKEADWAALETEVGEFEDERSARAYFAREYLPYAEVLAKRSIFVMNPAGETVGTLTAWWIDTDGKRDAALHWVGVRPKEQGKGIGKALVAEGLRRIVELEGETDVVLHTQTWSCPAINIYLRSGFTLLKTETFGGYKNEYDEAMKWIGEKLKWP